MNRIEKAFEKGRAFIPFVTVGDPDLETSEQIVDSLIEAGADLIELGIPFSDPTAEGPVIMEADLAALNAGTTTDLVFEFTKKIRARTEIPLIYMTYANVVFSYGTEGFLRKASDAGVDGLILPDVPFEEKEDFLPLCRKYGIRLISMIAPTSEQRISMIAREAEGFLYVVSSLGVTGVRTKITTDVASMIRTVRKFTRIPCAVGFGISDPEQAREMASLSDGAICGSAVMRIVAECGRNAAAPVGKFAKQMAEAVHST